MEQMGINAKKAAKVLSIEGKRKNDALINIAEDLIKRQDEILTANKVDIENGKNAGLTESLLDRLRLSKERIEDISKGIIKVSAMQDPIGKVLDGCKTENDLYIKKVRVPLGVIGIIYEARPNVTADAAALCLKAGNAVILRGGKEAINSNKAIVKIMRDSLERAGLPKDSIQLIEDTTRESSKKLMKMNKYLDVLIPRGGAGLIRSVVENATVPVIETGVGNCHIYVDEFANIDMAVNIINNAKTSRPSVCNAVETVLVHKNIAKELLPKMKAKLDEKNVELRGCEKCIEILGNEVIKATEDDYKYEFLDYILALKVVDNFDQAIEHIEKYSTHHSEAIITDNYENATNFTNTIDAAAVYVNASTRFTDGGQFGLGAEIGISTQKLHARGPMGINELTSMKFIINGNGQIR